MKAQSAPPVPAATRTSYQSSINTVRKKRTVHKAMSTVSTIGMRLTVRFVLIMGVPNASSHSEPPRRTASIHWKSPRKGEDEVTTYMQRVKRAQINQLKSNGWSTANPTVTRREYVSTRPILASEGRASWKQHTLSPLVGLFRHHFRG